MNTLRFVAALSIAWMSWFGSSAIAAPSISADPIPASVIVGSTTGTLTVNATGTGTLTYQWKKFGVNITGQTGQTLQLNGPGGTGVTLADAGLYSVDVTDTSPATITSKAARVDVVPPSYVGGVLRPKPGFMPRFEVAAADITAFAYFQHATDATQNKIYVAGEFTRASDAGGTLTQHLNILRLNANGTIDTTYNPPLIIGGGSIRALYVQPSDGKLVIGGDFTLINDATAGVVSRGRIARLNTNGSLDTSFVSGAGANTTVYAIVPQGSNYLVGGSFTSFSGTSINRLVRISAANGTVDTTFTQTGTGLSSDVRAIAVDTVNNTIYVGGLFQNYNNVTANATRIARLGPNGGLDAGFATGTGFGSDVRVLMLQDVGVPGTPDLRLLVGGTFTGFNTSGTVNRLIRLKLDGTIDTALNLGTVGNSSHGFNNDVLSLALDSSSRLYVAGNFTSFNNTSSNVNRLIRLTSGGALDTTFNNAASGFNSTVNAILLREADSQIYAGGFFTTYNGTGRTGFARVGTDGVIDSLAPVFRRPGVVFAIEPAPGGKWYVGGTFTHIDDTPRNNFAAFTSAGVLDPFVAAGTGFNNTVNAMVVLGDGRVVAGGSFSSFNGTTRNNILRMAADGTLDTTFTQTGTGLSSGVNTLAVQGDGRVVVAGNFTSYNGTTRNRIARLNFDGTLDSTLDAGTGFNGTVNQVALQSDGKILAAGSYSQFNSVTVNGFIRLTSAGLADSPYPATGTGMGGTTSNAVLIPFATTLANETPYVGGSFTAYNSVTRNRILHLNSDGTLDTTTFGVAAGVTLASSTVSALARQSDGKIIAGGFLTTANGVARPDFARFNADGTTDNFSVPSVLGNLVSNINVLRFAADGTVLAGATRIDFGETLASGSLIMLEVAPVPAFTANGQPTNSTTTQGGTATFTVGATGENLQYQWFRDSTLLTNQTSSTLTVPNVQLADLGNYTVKVSNLYGSITSNPALIVAANSPPAINSQSGPAVAATSGTQTTLMVDAQGTGLGYQWRRGGFPIAGQTGPNLVLNPAKRADADTYDVVINSGIAVTVSQPIRLTVAPVVQPQGLRLDTAAAPLLESNVSELITRMAIDSYTTPTPEKKFVVVGDFKNVAGQVRNRVARFNGDGNLDLQFVPAVNYPQAFSAVAVQSDHKVLVGGTLGATSTVDAKRVVRMNSDGSLDTTFNNNMPIIGGNPVVILVQGDGKILVGGQFSFFFNNKTRNRLVRLNSNGTLDESFFADINNTVNCLAIDGNGQILVGGNFTTVNGTGRTRVARLNSTDGSLDTNFNPAGTGPDGAVLTIAVTRDGINNIVIGGQFNNFNGNSTQRLARMTSTGGYDSTLALGSGFNGNINELACQVDGKILVTGGFTSLNNTSSNGSLSYNRLLRLNSNGSVDTTFATAGGPNSNGNALALYTTSVADDTVLVGGSWTAINNTAHVPLARFNGTGSLDSAVNPTMVNYATPAILAALPNGQWLVGSNVTAVDGSARFYLARFNANGTADNGYAPVFGAAVNATATLNAAAVRSDGKVYVVGGFTTVGGVAATRVARLNTDGTLDTGFVTTTGMSSTPSWVLLQPDGKVLVGGPTSFTYNGGSNRSGIVRLLPDGSPDPAWVNLNTSGGFNGTVNAAALQSDGKIVIGGNFTSLNGTTIPNAIRLNSDGSVDGGFTAGTFNNSVNAVTVIPGTPGSESILVGGGFTTIGTTTRNRVARLNSTGTLDLNFDAGTGANGTVNGFVLQEDGKVILRGNFNTFGPNNPPNTVNVARMLANGALDSSFGVYGLTTSGQVNGVLVLDDGTVELAGNMMYDNFVVRPSLAHTTPVVARFFTAQPQPATTNQGVDATFQVAADGTGPITYQWLLNGNPIAGATSNTLTVSSPTRDDAGSYSVQVTNLAGTITSNSVTLTVNSLPFISAISPTQLVDPQGNVTLFASIESEPSPTSVQWLKNGTPIPGATLPNYNIGNVQPSDAGTYSLVVTNSVGSSISVAQNPIVGGWSFTNAGPAHSTGVITFLPDGRYFLAEDGDATADPSGHDGMERGSYTWNPGNGAYTMTAKSDTNGGWGFAHMTGASTITVSGNTLTAGSTTFTRVTSASDPKVGSWAGGDNSGSFCLTFFADNTYFMAEDGDPETTGFPGMERGTYTYDANTGAFTATATVDTSGDWGVSGAVATVAFFGNKLVFTGEDTTLLDRVVPTATVLTVTGKPAISAGPVSAAVAVGGSTTLSVTATGTGTLSYQWRRNGAIITGATSTSLPVTLNAPGDAAIFDVVVTNASGSTTSRAASVVVDSTLLDESFTPVQFASPATALMEILSDGSYLVSSHIRQAAGTQLKDRGAGISRYLADGTPDPVFKMKYPADYGAFSSEVLPISSKFYAAVDTSRYLGTTPKATIARFYNDGTLDFSFTPYTFDPGITDDNVTGLLLQTDGKLIVSGQFTNVNGTGRSGMFRLNADGSLDSTFAVTTFSGGRGLYAAPVFDSTGRILVAGEFTNFNGSTITGIVRLDANGNRDTTFTPSGYSQGGAIRGLMVQSTGKIVIGGRFTVAGTQQIPFIRLNADGSIDSSFATFTVEKSGFINSDLIPLPGDKFAGTPLTLVVCNPDGTRVPTSEFTSPVRYDATDPFGDPISGITRVRRRADGFYLVGGNFTHLNGVAVPKFAILSPAGVVQPSLVDGMAVAQMPLTFVRTQNGHTLGGFINPSDGLTNASGTLVDLQADGSVATTPFSSSLTDSNFYFSFTRVGDGRIFVLAENPAGDRFFRRLMSDGSVDSSLTTTAAPAGGPKPDTVFVQPDYKTLIMAKYPEDQDIVNGENLRRINVNGSLDGGYTAQLDQVATPVRGTVLAGETFGPLQSVTRLGIEVLAVDATNHAYVRYPATGGVTRLARLNSDGSRDTGFSIITTPTVSGSSTSESITDPLRPNAAPATVTVITPSRREFLDVVLQPGGKIIVAGDFKSLTIDGNTSNLPGLARLNANGTLDATFNTGGSGPGWTVTPVTATDFPSVEAMVQQADGRILLAGNFESYNGMPAPGLVRINPNGTFDPTFVPPVARSPRYSTWPEMSLQDDGSVLLMGGYVVPGERFARGIVRLTINGAAPTITQNPAPATMVVGGSAMLSVVPAGPGPFTYQWKLGNADVPGATGPTLSLNNIQPLQLGDYKVVVSNPFSSVASNAATLTASTVANSYLSVTGFARPEFRHGILPGRATFGATSGKIYATWSNSWAVTGANNVRIGNVVRLNTNGTLDQTFNTSTFLSDAWAVVEQPDGKVLVAGLASFENNSTGKANYRIWRFDANGFVDPTYHSPLLAAMGRYMTLQPDGKLLVALSGPLDNGNGGLTASLFRLNADGSQDMTFIPPALTAPNGTGTVFATILVDAQNRILIAGVFNNVNGQGRLGVARLNPDGSLDSSFVPSGYTLGNIQMRGLGFQTQGANAGKILVAGNNINVSGTNRGVVRLNSNGSLDTSFVAPTVANAAGGPAPARPRLMEVLPDDRFYTVSDNVTRFNADGTIDATYTKPVFTVPNSSAGTNEFFWMALQPDGKVIVTPDAGGTVNGSAATSLVRFTDTGAIDSSFTPPNFQVEIYPEDGAVLAGGKFLTWGTFDTVNTTARAGLAKINADGTLDTSFVPAAVANQFGIVDAVPMPDGGALAVTSSGTSLFNLSFGVTRLTSTGAVDGTFTLDSSIAAVASGPGMWLFLQPDNKTLIWSQNAQRVVDGGLFIRRISPNGSLDAFPTGPTANYGAVFRDGNLNITSITVGGFGIFGAFSDGKLLAGGTKGPYTENSTSLDWTLYRLTSTGVVDTGFNAPTVSGPAFGGSATVTDPTKGVTSLFSTTEGDSPIRGAIPQADGGVIVSGDFSSLGGQAAPGIARLTSSGAVDTAFNVGSGPELRSQPGRMARIGVVTAATDGKLWVTGSFDTFGGVAAPGLVRLNANGSVDSSVATPLSFQPWVAVTPRVVLKSNYDAFVLGFGQANDLFPFGLNAISAPTPPSAPPPAPVTTAVGGSASFTVVPTGTGPFTYQWQKVGGSLGANASGATTATLTINPATANDAGSYTVTITGPGGASTTTPASLTVAVPPGITVPPQSQAVSVGQSFSLHVTATGTGPLHYDWRKNGSSLGAPDLPTYTVNSATAGVGGDAGSYTVNVSNAVNNVTSTAAVVTVLQAGFSATHVLQGSGYVAGATVTVTNTFNYPEDLAVLTWTILVPPGWKFVSGTYPGGSPAVEPGTDDPSGSLTWFWSNVPVSGSTFTYTLSVPPGTVGDKEFAALVAMTLSSNSVEYQFLAKPDPLAVPQLKFHDADTNGNSKIDVTELSRVITLYNARFTTVDGKIRTGAYTVSSGTVDGFAPDPTRDPTASVTLTRYHSADTNHNGKIDVTELSRVITLYNTRYTTPDGKIRTGYYRPVVVPPDTATVDGFTPDPTRAP